MPVLSHIHIEKFCSENQVLLREHRFVGQNQHIDLEGVNVQDKKKIINELLVNEENNKKRLKEAYQKKKNKSKYIIQLTTAALIFIGAGFALAPFFIASTIILPVFPFLLFSFAIIATTKLIFTSKNTSLEINVDHAVDILAELGKASSNVEQEIIDNSSSEVKEMKRITLAVSDQTENMSKKIDAIEEKTIQIVSKLGMFSTPPMPISSTDPANEFHNKEAMSHTK